MISFSAAYAVSPVKGVAVSGSAASQSEIRNPKSAMPLSAPMAVEEVLLDALHEHDPEWVATLIEDVRQRLQERGRSPHPAPPPAPAPSPPPPLPSASPAGPTGA